jgi:RNA polymerase sporulation-specific sigma factor
VCIRRRIYSAIRKLASPVGLPEWQYAYIDPQDAAMGPEEQLIDREKSDEFLKVFLADLSKLERGILNLYLTGDTYQEIAVKAGKSTKSVDNAIQRIRRKLTRITTVRPS